VALSAIRRAATSNQRRVQVRQSVRGISAGQRPLTKARLLAIITDSALFLATGNHPCAEATLYDADAYVVANATVFAGNSVDPNSYGRTRTRILNLFYTLYTRLDGFTNPITNNPLYIGSPLLNPGFSSPVRSKPHL
jgi:hypothetical protein